MLDGTQEFNSITEKEEQNFFLIDTEEEANKILLEILNDKGCILGIDIEAAVEMSRFGILCLLQICYNNQVFIFDMTVFNKKLDSLKYLFEDTSIVKVFHDCLEDCSLLLNYYKIDFKNIFDTQIAHRVCYEEICGTSNMTKHSAISLNDLLTEYLNIFNPIKYEIHIEMNKDPYFWKKRPLSQKMIEYAANDVIYLPQLYYIFCENAAYAKIMSECEKYLEYLKINLSIKNFNKINLETDRVIQGLLKNVQKNCIYVQLNIGYHGMITNKKSITKLIGTAKLGDIIHVKIIKLDQSKKRYLLDLADKSDYKEKGNNTPELIKIDLNKFLDNNSNTATNSKAIIGHPQRLSFDEPLSATKQIHSLINPIETENASKSTNNNNNNNTINSEFTKKLKLNPNAKPIHFSSKLKSDSDSIFNQDAKANNPNCAIKKTLNVNQNSFFPQSFSGKSSTGSKNVTASSNNNSTGNSFSKSIYDDSFDANSIYNISKNSNSNNNHYSINYALSNSSNNNNNNRGNSQGSKSFNFNQENIRNFMDSGNSSNSFNYDAINKNYVFNNNLFEESNDLYVNNINNPTHDDYFVKMNMKLNINAQPYTEIYNNSANNLN